MENIVMAASPRTPNLFEPIDFKQELLDALNKGAKDNELYFAYVFKKPFAAMMTVTSVAYDLGFFVADVQDKGFLTYFNLRRKNVYT
jgi:hypothetical protein